MATTTTKAQTRAQPAASTSKGEVAVLPPPRLPMPAEFEKEYDLNAGKWAVLIDSVFPAAKSLAAVSMALAYCKARKLDVFKRPVHIVPIWSTQHGRMIETVWPGINELRSTAMRTNNYAGMDKPEYGPTIEHTFAGGKIEVWENGQKFYKDDPATKMAFPEWCQITVYRLLAGNRVPFPGPRVYWLETYAQKGRGTDSPNAMWEKRSNGQLEKCAEAAALRRAFPEEIGDDHVIEEIGAFHTHAAAEPTDVTSEGSATTTTPSREPQRSDYANGQDSAQVPSQGHGPVSQQPEADSGHSGSPNKPPEGGAAPNGPSEPAPSDDDTIPGATEDWPPEWAREGGPPLEFVRFTKFSELVDFAEGFCTKTNKLGAQQFRAYYKNDLHHMENSKNPRVTEAWSWIDATLKEVENPPESKK